MGPDFKRSLGVIGVIRVGVTRVGTDCPGTGPKSRCRQDDTQDTKLFLTPLPTHVPWAFTKVIPVCTIVSIEVLINVL